MVSSWPLTFRGTLFLSLYHWTVWCGWPHRSVTEWPAITWLFFAGVEMTGTSGECIEIYDFNYSFSQQLGRVPFVSDTMCKILKVQQIHWRKTVLCAYSLTELSNIREAYYLWTHCIETATPSLPQSFSFSSTVLTFSMFLFNLRLLGLKHRNAQICIDFFDATYFHSSWTIHTVNSTHSPRYSRLVLALYIVCCSGDVWKWLIVFRMMIAVW